VIARQLEFDGTAIRIREVDLAQPTGAEVLLQAEYSNVSVGTELSGIREARDRGKIERGLGYSLVGVVSDAGPEAEVAVGERVLAQAPHASAALTDGSYAWLTPVPPDLDPAEATLGTLASVALHIVERARVHLGEVAVVFGYGVVGALVAQLVCRAGADRVIVVDPVDAKRGLAMKLGAAAAVAPEVTIIAEALSEYGRGTGADLVIEAAGHPSVFPAALEVLRTGGRLVCTSTFRDGLKVPLYPSVIAKELTLIGAHQPKCPLERVPYYPHSQVENRHLGLRMIDEGALEVGELITHHSAWHEAPALYAKIEHDSTALGVVLDWTAGAAAQEGVGK